MALNYNYVVYKDVYTLENTGTTILTYTVSRKECDLITNIKEGVIGLGETITLPIKHIDGVYSIEITDGVETTTLSDILFYNNLLLSVIDNIEKSICGCEKCKNCQEDCIECDLYLDALVTVLALQYVNSPLYNEYIIIAAETLRCEFSELILCMLTKEQIHGRQDTKDLLLKIIGLHYLAFYYKDISSSDEENITYINEKYKFSKINKCLKKIGVTIDPTIFEPFLIEQND